MASNQTSNFQLSQWEADDEVLRADFNRDNLKIETALSGLTQQAQSLASSLSAAYGPDNPPYVFGSYTGTGEDAHSLDFGFLPRAVIIFSGDGYGLICIRPATNSPVLKSAGSGSCSLSWTETGLTLYRKDYPADALNLEGESYYYLSIK